jgi:hypothetical protein
MKDYKIICVFKLILLLGLLCPEMLQGQENIKHYRRAPDVLPETLPEMRTPGFWIERSKQADELILSLEEIQQMNSSFQDRMKNLPALENGLGSAIEKQLKSWTGLTAVTPDLSSLSGEELKTSVQEMVKSQVLKMRNSKYGNVLGIQYADWEIDAFEKEMALEQVGEMEGLQSGITVCGSRIRVVPTIRPEHVAIGDNGRARWDMFNLDVVPVASEVQVLHRSASGAFLLVLCERGYGWIRSENIALASEEQVAECLPEQDFIVCTGEQVPFYTDASCRIVSGWLRMGDRVSYVENGGRIQVGIPFRKMDGSLSIEQAWLKQDADVSKGYLPYTRRHIIHQAFKLMDLVYDYTGGWMGRNHVTILRDLFVCFGFELPGNGVLLQAYNYAGSIQPEIGKEKQYQAMMDNEPFLTVQVTKGHSQLYLGEHEGTPYVFDTHGYSYTGEDEKEYVIRRSCIYTPELPGYMLKNELTFIKLR